LRSSVTLVLMAIVLTGSVILGQDLPASKVPAVVLQAFHSKFPGVKQVAWKLKAPTYDAEFLVKGAEVTVKFDASGKWQETESAIPKGKVPAGVNESIAKRFGAYKVIETQDMQRADDPRTRYEIHLQNAKEIVKVLFYDDGTIISQSAKPRAAAKK
jgi:hypothetical protein